MLVIEKKKKPKFRTIPSYLVYEEMNGKPLLHKGFMDVLSGKKKVEELWVVVHCNQLLCIY
ncbi:MAG: hypothetical protein U5N85_16075 [Arcicella sp.]|nr:hypothetical protein [Arcicella sp.]